MSIDGEIRNWLQKSLEIEVHKAGRGNPQALIDWYNNGADGQIEWGSHGDFDACVAIAGKYLDNPEGFCQLRHIDATGEPAGKAAGEITKAEEEIDYEEVFSSKDGEPSDKDLYEQVKADAQKKFKVYPSAVANGWVVQEYKRRGGKYRKPVAKDANESLADVLRHDEGHDRWHRMHGDEPCKSEADCARMRAKYAEVKAEEKAAQEKAESAVAKYGTPGNSGEPDGHPFRGNQWTDSAGGGGGDSKGSGGSKDGDKPAKGSKDWAHGIVTEITTGGNPKVAPDELLDFFRQVPKLDESLQLADATEIDAGAGPRGTLLGDEGVGGGVPRNDMPQIKPEQRPEFIKLMKDKYGVDTELVSVDPTTLSPYQMEMVTGKIAGLVADNPNGMPESSRILISKDNIVIDGHHNWAAAVALHEGLPSKPKLPIYRIDMKASELVPIAKKFGESKGNESKGMTMKKEFAPNQERLLMEKAEGGNAEKATKLIMEAISANIRRNHKASKKKVEKGDLPGHPFHGNQYTEGLVFTKPDKALVSNTIPKNVGHRDFDINTTLRQIGRMNIAAASGGRVSPITGPQGGNPIGVELPVGSGYRVRVYLADNDTYTVQRVYHTAARETVKGQVNDVFAEQLGEKVYDASCFVNVPFGADDLAD